MKSVSSRSMIRCLRTTLLGALARPAAVRIASLCSPRSTSPSASSRFSISPAEARETPSISATREASVGRAGRRAAGTRRSGTRGSRSSPGTRRSVPVAIALDRSCRPLCKVTLTTREHRRRPSSSARSPASRSSSACRSGRVRARRPALRAALTALATGILVFLFWDVLSHGVEPVETHSRRHDWARVRAATPRCSQAASRRPDEPRLLRPLAEATGARRRSSGRAPRRSTSSSTRLDRRAHARPAARAADRDRDRPAQLRRGPRDRPVGRGRRDLARARPDHRLRRCTTRPRASASSGRWRTRPSGRAGASSACSGLIGGGPTFLGTVIGQAWVSRRSQVVFFAVAGGLDPLRRDPARSRSTAATRCRCSSPGWLLARDRCSASRTDFVLGRRRRLSHLRCWRRRLGAFSHAVAGLLSTTWPTVQWTASGSRSRCQSSKLLVPRPSRGGTSCARPTRTTGSAYRSVLGAYVAGVGVNSIAPARGGDVVKLYLVRQPDPGTRRTRRSRRR